MKRNKGITLIALVITIIVLLILAAVSIATLTGENGILTQAQKAKEKTKISGVEEQRQLAIGEAATNFEETEYQGIKIPAGMAPTRIEGESTIDEGLVAIDKKGNEWVWIEVPQSIYTKTEYNNEIGTPEGKTDYAKIAGILKKYAATYTKGSATQSYEWKDEYYDGCGIEAKGEKEAGEVYTEMYHKMLESVYNNGGFWIGRYEAGIEGSTGKDATNLGRTISNQPRININSQKAISQKDAIPYNYVYCSEAQKLASQMTPDGTRTSSLMFGIQWDLVCKFIEEKEVGSKDTIVASINSDSGSWGNYKNQSIKIDSENAKQYTSSSGWSTITKGETKPASSILLSTGALDSTKRLNIYDLAGNEWEWTLEQAIAFSYGPCSNRGGCFDDDSASFPASSRWGGLTDGCRLQPFISPSFILKI